MKKVFTSPNSAEVGLLAGVLEDQGIPCLVKNHHISMLAGSVPFAETWPEIWVHDENEANATTLIDEWRNATDAEDEIDADNHSD